MLQLTLHSFTLSYKIVWLVTIFGNSWIAPTLGLADPAPTIYKYLRQNVHKKTTPPLIRDIKAGYVLGFGGVILRILERAILETEPGYEISREERDKYSPLLKYASLRYIKINSGCDQESNPNTNGCQDPKGLFLPPKRSAKLLNIQTSFPFGYLPKDFHLWA